jgi:hypothetical protein
MTVYRPLLTGLAAALVGVAAGAWHWYAKPLVAIGPCQGAMICISHSVRPGLGVDDALVGLVAAIVAAVIAQIVLRLFDRRARRAAHTSSG